MGTFLAPRVGRLAVAAALLNVIAAQILHEAGHWLVLSSTGRRPVWGITALVQLSDRVPIDPTEWVSAEGPDGSSTWLRLQALPDSDGEWLAFLVAGPLAQLFGLGVGLWLARRAHRPTIRSIGLMVALVNGLGHALYQLVSALQGGGGDETLLAEYAGIPWWWFSLTFGLIAAAGFVFALRLLPDTATRMRWGVSSFVGSVAVGPVFMRLQAAIVDGVDRGEALFTPVLGYSLPVILLATASGLGLWMLLRRWPLAANRHVPHRA